MNQNPFESPPAQPGRESHDNLFANALRESRKRKLSWDLRCWLYGGGSIIAAFPLWQIAWDYLCSDPENFLFLAMTVAADILFVAGLLAIVFGPMAWFWMPKHAQNSSTSVIPPEASEQ